MRRRLRVAWLCDRALGVADGMGHTDFPALDVLATEAHSADSYLERSHVIAT
jgi:hypothetical protein